MRSVVKSTFFAVLIFASTSLDTASSDQTDKGIRYYEF